MVGPSAPETDVGQADGAPGEEGSETGQGQKPVEDNGTTGGERDVGDGAEGDAEGDGDGRTTSLVDEGEDLGCVALLSESSERTRATVDTGETDGEDGNHDNNVHEVTETGDTSVLGDNDEGRGSDINETRAEETVGVVGDEETDEEERQDVEEGDTPEDLLDGGGSDF